MHFQAAKPNTPRETSKPQRNSASPSPLRRSSLCGAVCLGFIIHLSSFILSPAAPPPELTILRQQYDKVIAERVTAPFDASKTALDEKFTAALTNAITTAKQAGKLDDVLAIQDDQKRLADKIPLPDDTETTPAALKTLRAIYREQLKKLEDTRTSNHAALLPAYTAKLTELEATLVKNDRIDEAKELRTYRESLVAGALPAAETPMAKAPATPTAPVGDPTAKKVEIPVIAPEQEREVALEILKLGPADIKAKAADGKEVMITSPETLPEGVIQIIAVLVKGVTEGKSRPGKMLTPLAGLPSLKKLILQHFPLHDDDMDVIAALPALREFHNEFTRSPTFTGKKLHLLGDSSSLTQINLSECPLEKPAYEALGRISTLTVLKLVKAGATDDDLKPLASLTQLADLDLRRNEVTAKGLLHLANLRGIQRFGWSPDPKAEKGGFTEIAKLFPNLSVLSLARSNSARDEHYEGISDLPSLRKVSITADDKPGIMLKAISAAPQIEGLQGYLWDGVQDAELVHLQNAKGITTVSIAVANDITSKGLMHLSKMPKLRKLTLERLKKITDADAAEFKRVRPDVEFKLTR